MNIQNAMENLKKRGFAVSFFETKDDATNYLKDKIQNTSVGFGGSVTVDEMGLYDALAEKNTVWSHHHGDRETEIAGASTADVYISSVNGAAESGELINIDGAGNRVSSTLYGKKEVYFVVGINKFADDYDGALWRARNIASPKNCHRLNVKTPCAEKADKCYDCSSPDRICRGLVVLWGPMRAAEKTEVVIVNEALGY